MEELCHRITDSLRKQYFVFLAAKWYEAHEISPKVKDKHEEILSNYIFSEMYLFSENS